MGKSEVDLAKSRPKEAETFTLCGLLAFKTRTLVNPHESQVGGDLDNVTKPREVQARGECFESLGEGGGGCCLPGSY